MAVAARTDGSLRSTRAVLVGVAAVHLVYPVGAAVALSVWPGADGNADASAALVALPVIFLIMALVIGPPFWGAWNGSRLAVWILSACVALETWLYWNGSRTPSWRVEPSSADRFALAMCGFHAVAAVALLGVAVSREMPGRRERLPEAGRRP